MGVAFALSGCGIRQLEPRAAPAKSRPAVDEPDYAMPEGHARLFIDVEGEPARVSEVLSVSQDVKEEPFTLVLPSTGGFSVKSTYMVATPQTRRATKPLCSTPCVLDLPHGPNALELTSLERDYSEIVTIPLEPGRSAYVHRLGKATGPDGGFIGSVVVLSAGISLAVVSPLVFVADENEIGAGMLLSGLALAVVGYFLYDENRPEVQAGAATYWPLD